MFSSMTGRQRLVAGVVGACALLAVFAGCGAAPVAPPTAQQIYNNAMQSKMKDASVTLTGTVATTTSGISLTLTMSGTGQVVLKPANASHLTINATISSAQINGTLTSDVITVGGYSYTKSNVQIPGIPTPPATLYTKAAAPDTSSSILPQVASNLVTVKEVGEDTIRGDKCWHLTVTEYTDAQGTPVASTTAGATPFVADEWIRESDYYYVRLKASTLPGFSLPLGGTSTGSSGSAASNVGFTIDLSNYDSGVTIAPPPADQVQG